MRHVIQYESAGWLKTEPFSGTIQAPYPKRIYFENRVIVQKRSSAATGHRARLQRNARVRLVEDPRRGLRRVHLRDSANRLGRHSAVGNCASTWPAVVHDHARLRLS